MSRPTKVDIARGRAIITGSKQDWAAVEREQRLADYVERVVSQAPPLSFEQRCRIARLLDGAA